MDQKDISFYEELQSNAFPALQTVMYDGWSVRFGGGFTYRVNCANPMYPGVLPAEEKLGYVERLYREAGYDRAIVKLHDGMDSACLAECERILDGWGYGTERHGILHVCDLEAFPLRPKARVQLQPVMEDRWLEGFLTMNGTGDAQREAAMTMLKNIRYPIAAASITESGKMAACGLGVMERGHVGLYDIYVDAACRRRGLGGDICAAIMQWGRARGCAEAYLQVLSDNLGARAMYRKMGYRETYSYWFRVKNF